MPDKSTEPGAARDPLAPASRPSRKKYQAPKLVEYGDLRRIVLAKSGFSADGKGSPATKR